MRLSLHASMAHSVGHILFTEAIQIGTFCLGCAGTAQVAGDAVVATVAVVRDRDASSEETIMGTALHFVDAAGILEGLISKEVEIEGLPNRGLIFKSEALIQRICTRHTFGGLGYRRHGLAGLQTGW